MMRETAPAALLLVLCLLAAAMPLRAQDESESTGGAYTDLEFYAIDAQLRGYLYDLDLIAMELPLAGKPRLMSLAGACRRLDAKRTLYVQTNQDAISADEGLMDLMGECQERFALIADSIQSSIDRCDRLVEFSSIERSMSSRDTTYESFLERARLLSLTDKTAQQLALVKKEEEALRQTLDAQYARAGEICAADPFLETRMQAVTECYTNLSVISDKVQATEYKPLFERIKEYIYGIAAVALILMFVNMVSTKVKAAKQMREQAKQLRESLRKQNNDYPSI